MSRTQEIQLLMEQLGPSHPNVSNVTQVSGNTWAVGFDTDTIVMLELDNEERNLVLMAEIGQPNGSGDRGKICEMLLTYNALWRETGGVKMAMAGGEAMQLYSMDAAEVTMASLRTVLENFVEKAKVWRRFVETGGPVEQAAAPAGMRV
jgi:hypothetical protein